MTELHLGHTAKSFGLREPPGGIGSGIDRKAKKNHKGGRDNKNSNKKAGASTKSAAAPSAPRDEGGMDEMSAQALLKRKSMMLMRAGADEFNIG